MPKRKWVYRNGELVQIEGPPWYPPQDKSIDEVWQEMTKEGGENAPAVDIPPRHRSAG